MRRFGLAAGALVVVGVLASAAPAQAFVRSPGAVAAEAIVMSDPAFVGYATATVTAAEMATVTVGTTQAVVGAGVLAGAAVAAGGLSIAAGGLDAFTWSPEDGFIPSGSGDAPGYASFTDSYGRSVAGLINGGSFTFTERVGYESRTTVDLGVDWFLGSYTALRPDTGGTPDPQGLFEAYAATPAANISYGDYGYLRCGGPWSNPPQLFAVDYFGTSSSVSGCPIYFLTGNSGGWAIVGYADYQPGGSVATVTETLVCQTSTGGLYTRVAEVPANLPEYQLGGLLCDPGDWVYDYSLQLVTDTGTTDVIDSPTKGLTWEAMPSDQKSDLLAPGSTSQLTQEADGSTSVDTIVGGGGNEDCSFAWGDLLTGGVLLKGLSCAFIPSDGYMEATMSQVQAKWEASSIGQAVNVVTAIPVAFGSMLLGIEDSCDPLVLPLSSVPAWKGVTWDDIVLIEPCTDPWPGIATTIKIVFSFVLIWSAGPRLLNPLLEAMGMPPLRLGGSRTEGAS